MTDHLEPVAPHPGAAGTPTGNPMIDGVGAASWADRPDSPDLTLEGEPKIQPMSILPTFAIHTRDPDPRGMSVIGADGEIAGEVVDIWVDRSEPQIRYLAVELAAGGDRVLLPMGFAKVDRSAGTIKVIAIMSHQFADVPRVAAPDRVTLLEEDKIVAYFAGGYRYAEPSRLEPLF